MRYYIVHHVARSIAFRRSADDRFDRLDAGAWIPVPDVDLESFLLDPFTDAISAADARDRGAPD